MFLPHIIALRRASKSSLVKISWECSFAAAQPDPIEIPISAMERALISLIPSPVAATFLPRLWSPTTKACLSSAEALARTLKSCAIYLNAPMFSICPSWILPISFLNWWASITAYLLLASWLSRIPALMAISLAVSMWSPLTRVIPILAWLLAYWTQLWTRGLRWSFSPKVPK